MKASMTPEETPCVEYSNVYQNPLLDGSQRPTTGGQRREQQMLLNQATTLCGGCPIQSKCLTQAVVSFDVAGFVAGTTEAERRQIRAVLGLKMPAEDLDAHLGVRSGRKVNRDEIHRIRSANPMETLSNIAERIGCSVSTVKRHLRQLRAEAAMPVMVNTVTTDEVMAAAQAVLGGETQAA